MIDSIIVNGNNILVTNDILSKYQNIFPSKVQLHRAMTDNDRMGYLPIWKVIGLDMDFVYLPTIEAITVIHFFFSLLAD